MGVVLAPEVHREALDMDPVAFLGVALGLLDLADETGVHRLSSLRGAAINDSARAVVGVCRKAQGTGRYEPVPSWSPIRLSATPTIRNSSSCVAWSPSDPILGPAGQGRQGLGWKLDMPGTCVLSSAGGSVDGCGRGFVLSLRGVDKSPPG